MARFDANRFRTEKQTWETPDGLFNMLNNEFNFDIDVASNNLNKKCNDTIDETVNALSVDWKGTCWLNPPYGGSGANSLKNWVKKAFDESRRGCVVVILIPARTNTEWWHKYCMKAKEIRFIKGRPKFKGCKHGLPQPLAIVVFDGNYNKAILKTQEML